MFQHRVSSADNILSQAMRMTELDRLLPMSYTVGGGLPSGVTNGNGKDRRNDVGVVGNIAGAIGVSGTGAVGNVCGYDPSAMFTIPTGDVSNQPPFVILPRADLEYLKQEVASLKNSMAEFQGVVNCELQKLRMESQALKQQVDNQGCACKGTCRKTNGNAADKTANEWDGNSTYGQTVDVSALACNTESATGEVSTPVTFSSMSALNAAGSIVSPAFSICPASVQSDCPSMSADHKPMTQLLQNYDVYVNKLSLQIIINEAQQHKENGPLFVLRRIIPLVFTWEELASSRGQGLNCKSTDDVNTKFPLDPTRVMACKAFMRKFCMEHGVIEPPEKAVNQTFNHQVNYSRRRIRGPRHKPNAMPVGVGVEGFDTKPILRGVSQHTSLHKTAAASHAAQQQQQQTQSDCKVVDRTNKYMQMQM